MPPRRMTSTNRLPSLPALPAKDSVDQAPSAPAAALPASSRRRLGERRASEAGESSFMVNLDLDSSTLEFRREQEQGKRLRAIGGTVDLL